jgi:hypothetical protein
MASKEKQRKRSIKHAPGNSTRVGGDTVSLSYSFFSAMLYA